MIPSSTTGIRTPYDIFTGLKSQIPLYPFGTIGFFYHKRQDLQYERAETGIFISHGMHQRYLKAYLPLRLGIYSMRKMVVVPGTKPPPEWKLTRTKPSNIQLFPTADEPVAPISSTFHPNLDVQTGINTLPTSTVNSQASTSSPIVTDTTSSSNNFSPTIDTVHEQQSSQTNDQHTTPIVSTVNDSQPQSLNQEVY